MDPDALLHDVIVDAKEILLEIDSDEDRAAPALIRAEQLAEGILNLHDWITKGGFLPQSWIKAQRRNFQPLTK